MAILGSLNQLDWTEMHSRAELTKPRGLVWAGESAWLCADVKLAAQFALRCEFGSFGCRISGNIYLTPNPSDKSVPRLKSQHAKKLDRSAPAKATD